MWYQVKGNESDIVVSSRVRLARNLAGFPFDGKLTDKDAKTIIDKIEAALAGKNYIKTDMESLSPTAAEALVEKHLISREFAEKKTPHALFVNEGKSISLMACEEDHIRLQCILPGLALSDALRLAFECDDALDALDIAFDEKLGYLTHCPTNLGTGLRASVMLFLPCLTEGGAIPSLSRQLAKVGLTLRGLYGEGSESRGYLYQISNQISLGVSEDEILTRLQKAVENIVARERELQNEPKGEEAARRDDRIARAEGTLRYAELLSSEELFRLFADVKLGITQGKVKGISHEALLTLLINAMPATLTENAADKPKTLFERDRERARFIKQALGV